MSEWYDASDEDIDLDDLNKSVDIWVKNDYSGNVFVSLTFDQIKKLYAEIMEAEKK